MEAKVELKLLETIYRFKGMILKAATFKEKEVQGKKLLTLELTFSDDDLYQTMVLVLKGNSSKRPLEMLKLGRYVKKNLSSLSKQKIVQGEKG